MDALGRVRGGRRVGSGVVEKADRVSAGMTIMLPRLRFFAGTLNRFSYRSEVAGLIRIQAQDILYIQ